MDQFTTDQIRNVVLLAHSGAGKTSLAEAMLFATGAIPRLGKVEDGTTVADFEPEEHRRRTSLQIAVVPCVWKGVKINVLDTPGYADFVGETASALRVADAAVIVLSAQAGVEVGAEMLWRRVRALNMPTLVFVSKMDKEHADFGKALSQAVSRLGTGCAPMTIPVGAEHSFSGVLDVLDASAPDAVKARERLTEAVAETDDKLTEAYLEAGALTTAALAAGTRTAVRSGKLTPVLAGSATTGAGVPELLDAIVNYLPSPQEAPHPQATKGGVAVKLAPDPKGPLAAFVFKTSADPFVGRLTYLRVFSGTLTPNTEVWDVTRNHAERVGQVAVPVGKTQQPVLAVRAGDIATLSKLTGVLTGDTLTTRADALQLPGIQFPMPVYTVAVHPKSKADLEKLSTALARLVEEDPSLKLSREAATAELLVTGMGDTHVEVMAERAKRKFGVDLDLAPPRVPYRETIGRITTVEHKHKKQSGGHGQYGHVVMRLEPAARGAGASFGNAVVGGKVPKEYVPAVEKGVHKAMEEGAYAGFPITDIRVLLTDGSSHPVDSSGQSFEIASIAAVKEGVRDAHPVLLEPVVRMQITVPEECTGAVVGDLNTRRAHIAGMAPDGGVAVIDALAPLGEAQQYATKLRALTQGRGVFTMAFDHYGEVPSHLAQRIVEERQKETAKA